MEAYLAVNPNRCADSLLSDVKSLHEVDSHVLYAGRSRTGIATCEIKATVLPAPPPSCLSVLPLKAPFFPSVLRHSSHPEGEEPAKEMDQCQAPRDARQHLRMQFSQNKSHS